MTIPNGGDGRRRASSSVSATSGERGVAVVTTRAVFVAAVSVLLFAPAAAVGSSASRDGAGIVSNSGSVSSSAQPKDRLIVLDQAIGGIRLGEPRRSVAKAFGPGKSTERGVVSYFGGRLQVDYWFHDQLTTRVESLETRWEGFHTRSGVQIGTRRQALRALHVSCRNGECSRTAGRLPDAPGTLFKMRAGKVAQIDILYG